MRTGVVMVVILLFLLIYSVAFEFRVVKRVIARGES